MGQKALFARYVRCAVAEGFDERQKHESGYAQDGGSNASPTAFNRCPTFIPAFTHHPWIPQCSVAAKKPFYPVSRSRLTRDLVLDSRLPFGGELEPGRSE